MTDDDNPAQRADMLMRRAGASPAGSTPIVAGEIPTLTDLVSPGPGNSSSAAIGSLPEADSSQHAALGPDQLDALETEVYGRLQGRLDREIGLLLERRVMPGLAGSLDHAMQQLSSELKGSVRQMVREAIEDTLNQHLRNRPLPLAEGADPDVPAPQR
jgi:hypothetical protein